MTSNGPDPFASPSPESQGQPGQGQPGYGQPGYGQPPPYGAYGNAGYSQTPYGRPGYDQAGYNQPGYGQPGLGGMVYGPGSVGYGIQQALGTNGFAIAAAIFGIIPFLAGVLGIIFGFIARGQIKRTGQPGRGLALTGIIGGFIWLGLIIVGISLAIAFGSSTSSTCVNSTYDTYTHTFSGCN